MSCNKLENTESDLNLLIFAWLGAAAGETTRETAKRGKPHAKNGPFSVFYNNNNLVTPY